MRTTITLFLLVLHLPLWASAWEKLPQWAGDALTETGDAEPPADTAVWRLLDETEITLLSNGKLKRERRILRRVFKDLDSEHAGSYVLPSHEHGAKITRLRGWHLMAGDKLEKLDKENIVTLGLSSSDFVASQTITIAGFDQVSRGSIVAFESREIQDAFFTVAMLTVIGDYPTKKMVIGLSTEKNADPGRIVPINFDPWGLDSDLRGARLTIRNIPASVDEILAPNFSDPYPRVLVGFARGEESDPFESWDHLARWYLRLFTNTSLGGAREIKPIGSTDVLRKIATYFNEKITYRQRYLSPARGWTPEPGKLVERRAYGDCKDMVSCLAWRGIGLGFSVFPALANIGSGQRTGPEDQPAPSFNHVIGAIPLQHSLELPAEVDVGGRLMLLYDPTSKYTRLGWLPAHYKGRQLMVCTEKGAVWIPVPDAALERESVMLTLGGVLDQQFNLAGTIEIVEEGDAYFFRSLSRNGNPRDLEARLREYLSLPGLVDLNPLSQEVDEQHRLKLVYQVSWPSFLRRDMGGLRLPRGMVGYLKHPVVQPGKSRFHPIALSQRPKTTWLLEVNSQVPLEPGAESAHWQGEYDAFEWKASGGKMLQVRFHLERNSAYFSKKNIEEGVAYWNTYRKKFNEFWIGGTLFYPSKTP